MLEIEIKAWCDDPARVETALNASGATLAANLIQTDMYYNHPSRDFGQTDEAFRIRTSNDETLITYKGPKLSDKSKARFEKETAISDPAAFSEILDRLGFRRAGVVRKNRNEYLLGDIHICVDRVEGLGTFVEFEQCGDNLACIEPQLFACAERFGLDRFERRSYLTLLLQKNKTETEQ